MRRRVARIMKSSFVRGDMRVTPLLKVLSAVLMALVLAGCASRPNESVSQTPQTGSMPTGFSDTLVGVQGIANFTQKYDGAKAETALRQIGYQVSRSDQFGIEAKRNATALSIHVPADGTNWTLLVTYDVSPPKNMSSNAEESAAVNDAWASAQPQFARAVGEFERAYGSMHQGIVVHPIITSG